MRPKSIAEFPIPADAIGFRPEYLDFRRGIHVGNLEENERITRILKLALEACYRRGFVTERWGRGVFWKWIGFLPRANREAKPISSNVSFGCSKFFITVDTDAGEFKCGAQIERGYVSPPRDSKIFKLCSDWDWHRLIKGLRPGGPMEKELRRLIVREGFSLSSGSWEDELGQFRKGKYPGTRRLRKLLDSAPKNRWAGVQLYYGMSQDEVRATPGAELVDSMLAVFRELTTFMNLTMQIKLVDSQH